MDLAEFRDEPVHQGRRGLRVEAGALEILDQSRPRAGGLLRLVPGVDDRLGQLGDVARRYIRVEPGLRQVVDQLLPRWVRLVVCAAAVLDAGGELRYCRVCLRGSEPG